MIINVRETKAWLRGRYPHLPSLMINKVSHRFILPYPSSNPTADSFPIELGDIPSDASTPAASMAFVVGTLNKAESRTHEIDI